MRKELRDRAVAFNKMIAAERSMAGDTDIIISEMLRLPYGQLKKVLTEPVMEVLKKYGYGEEET